MSSLASTNKEDPPPPSSTSTTTTTVTEHPSDCTCGLHKMTSLHDMASKRKKHQEQVKKEADAVKSLLERLEEKLNIAEENKNRSEVVVLKRQIKKALISTHQVSTELPSLEKLDYDDFVGYEFFGQRVYLGRFRPAVHHPQLLVSELSVAGILNVTEEFESPNIEGVLTKKIPVKDRPSEGPRLAAYFQQASAFLDGLNNRPVYVHCRQGVSRSVTVLLAHLIIKGVELRKGYEMILKDRPSAKPNAGFWAELCKFELKVLKKNSYPLEEYMPPRAKVDLKHETKGMNQRIDSILKARAHGFPPFLRILCRNFGAKAQGKQQGDGQQDDIAVDQIGFDRSADSNNVPRIQKTIHFAMHGEAGHNALAREIGKKAYVHPSMHDPPLTIKGKQDAALLQNKMKELADANQLDVIISSPMNRALMTADIGCALVDHDSIDRIVIESVRERFGHHICDGRRVRSKIKAEFPHFNFDTLEHEEDLLHTAERETYAQMIERACDFFAWLMSKPNYKSVAVYSHSSFLFTIFQGVFEYPDDSADGGVNTSWFENGECRSVDITMMMNAQIGL